MNGRNCRAISRMINIIASKSPGQADHRALRKYFKKMIRRVKKRGSAQDRATMYSDFKGVSRSVDFKPFILKVH